jgi:membrane protease YdiL (CAAX protease family)
MAQYDTPFAAAPEEPQARPRKWPLAAVMLIDLVIILVIVLLLTLIISSVLVGVRAVQQGVPLGQGGAISEEQILRLLGADGVFLSLLVQNAVCVLIPVARVALIRREPLAQIGFRAQRLLRLVLIGVGVGILSLLVNIVIGSLFERLGIRSSQAEQIAQQFSLTPSNTLGQALFLIGGGLLAPVGEETLFRGYVFNALRQTFSARTWGVALAYVASALLFSVVHAPGILEGAIALVVPIFAIGLLLAWAMHFTGSLIPCIIAHAINNGVALVALIACVNDPSMAGCPQL